MEEVPENGKELSHSAHVNGMNVLFLNILLHIFLSLVNIRQQRL